MLFAAALSCCDDSFETVRPAIKDLPGKVPFSPPVYFESYNTPLAACLGDFNGDGHDDIAVANAATDDVSVMAGTGDGVFINKTMYAVGYSPYETRTL